MFYNDDSRKDCAILPHDSFSDFIVNSPVHLIMNCTIYFSDCSIVVIKKKRLGKYKEGIIIALREIEHLKDLREQFNYFETSTEYNYHKFVSE